MKHIIPLFYLASLVVILTHGVEAREFCWMIKPVIWYPLTVVIFCLTRKHLTSKLAGAFRILGLLGLSLNGFVTQANGGTMPVVGMPENFVAASNLWQRAHSNTRFLFLADQSSLSYFSVGDLLLISGGIGIASCWIYKHFLRGKYESIVQFVA